MKDKTDISVINQPWPADDLESVEACPYCSSKERKVVYKDVQDWSFYCAPGKWTYWECSACDALYLSPRPTEASIGRAYASYYTHTVNANSLLQKIKTRLRNECYSDWFDTDITPRLHLPKSIDFLLTPLKKILEMPFELATLAALPKGKLLDVGCGSGNALMLAKNLGWDVTGLEIDSNAVKAAREQGFNVIEGDYRKLEQFEESFDCVICSHVLEHVHQPLMLLTLLSKTLKSQGTLLLSLPNAKSHMRNQFGENWRALEAPRHLGIPALQKVITILQTEGFTQIQQVDIYGATLLESNKIARRLHAWSTKHYIYYEYYKLRQKIAKRTLATQSDYIQIIARKGV